MAYQAPNIQLCASGSGGGEITNSPDWLHFDFKN